MAKPKDTVKSKIRLHNGKRGVYYAYVTPSELVILVNDYGAILDYPSEALLSEWIAKGISNPTYAYMKFRGGLPF